MFKGHRGASGLDFHMVTNNRFVVAFKALLNISKIKMDQTDNTRMSIIIKR